MRWAAPHGWAVGKVTSQITIHDFDATPLQKLQLSLHMDRRLDQWVGQTTSMLKLDQYGGGPAAEYGSWVILTKTSEI